MVDYTEFLNGFSATLFIDSDGHTGEALANTSEAEFAASALQSARSVEESDSSDKQIGSDIVHAISVSGTMVDALYSHHRLLESMFRFLDRSGDGLISVEDLRQGIDILNASLPEDAQTREIDKLVTIMDVSGKGQVDINEFFEMFRLSDAQLNISGLLASSSVAPPPSSGLSSPSTPSPRGSRFTAIKATSQDSIPPPLKFTQLSVSSKDRRRGSCTAVEDPPQVAASSSASFLTQGDDITRSLSLEVKPSVTSPKSLISIINHLHGPIASQAETPPEGVADSPSLAGTEIEALRAAKTSRKRPSKEFNLVPSKEVTLASERERESEVVVKQVIAVSPGITLQTFQTLPASKSNQ
jgi:Ca2+-binding EF-hand superfamily protein